MKHIASPLKGFEKLEVDFKLKNPSGIFGKKENQEIIRKQNTEKCFDIYGNASDQLVKNRHFNEYGSKSLALQGKLL